MTIQKTESTSQMIVTNGLQILARIIAREIVNQGSLNSRPKFENSQSNLADETLKDVA